MTTETEDEATLIARVRAKPDDARAWQRLGVLYGKAGRSPRAIVAFRETLRFRPDDPAAFNGIGIIWASLGYNDRAIAAFESALSRRPGYAEAHYNLAKVLSTVGREPLALAALREALRLRPSYLAARKELADKLTARKAFDEALEHRRFLAEAHPDDGPSQELYAALLSRIGRHEESIARYRRTLELTPESIGAWIGLGVAHIRMNQIEQAEAPLEKARALAPEVAPVYQNLGLIQERRGKPADAIALYRRCHELDPKATEGVAGIGMCKLKLGDFEGGFADYEVREDSSNERRHTVLRSRPGLREWRGEAVAKGASLLVFDEQGLGDMLHFARFVPEAARRFDRVVVECRPPLTRIFAESFGPRIELRGRTDPLPIDLPDHYIRIMSLAHALRERIDTVGRYVPYLRAPGELVATWGAKLPRRDGRPRIGLVWAGNPQNPRDGLRSVTLDQLAPLLALDRVRWVSMQKEVDAATAARLDAAGIDRTIEAVTDFADTAAILAHLDLLITVDTSVAHLAGALGRPVWMMSRHESEWRWMLERADSPWYPTMRVFRQARAGDWPATIAAVREALVPRLGAASPPRSVARELAGGE
ncbi:MAG: tetratricopeptide repeat protein [Alphaproteobacteria bacterium]